MMPDAGVKHHETDLHIESGFITDFNKLEMFLFWIQILAQKSVRDSAAYIYCQKI